MDKYISEFINKYANDAFFKNYLKNSFSMLLKDYYKKYDIEKYRYLLIWNNDQLKLHNIMKKEVDDLFLYANQNGFPIIGLKGMFIENEFWNETRFYGDIDLYIYGSNIILLRDYLKKNDFYPTTKYRFRSRKRMNINSITSYNFDKNHHYVVHKKIDDPCLFFNEIEIELHGSLNSLKMCHFDDALLVKDKLCFNNYYTLLYEDQLIFCCYHTIQHLPYVCHDIIENFEIKIDHLYDFYRIIQSVSIDWEKFVEKILHYDASPICAVFLIAFNEVFQNILPDTLIKFLIEVSLKKDFYWKNIFIKILTLEPYKIIIGDYRDIEILYNGYLHTKSKYKKIISNGIFYKVAMENWKHELVKINKKLKN